MEYSPKNILVTGGAGFIASHVVIELVQKFPEYRVITIDKCDYCSSSKNLTEIKDAPNHKFIKGDILDYNLINFILQEYSIDTILHLAAQSHVDNSFGNSIDFTKNNVVGTHILLECAKIYGNIKKFIHISTDEVYGEVHAEGARETSILDPTNPYAATKAGAEFLVKAYNYSFKLPTIITRGNNVYGPHQYPEKLIPKFICRLKKDLPCCIHGNGSNKRMFLYVKDVANALIMIIHKGSIGETYNIGCDTEFSVIQVAKTLISLMDKPCDSIEFVGDRNFNDCRYAVDSSKLHALGWKPEVSWDTGIQNTIDWYEKCNIISYWDKTAENALEPHPLQKL